MHTNAARLSSFHLFSLLSNSSLMSHFYPWNYLRSAVIIEFSDPRTPAPSLYPLLPYPLLYRAPLKSSINVLPNALIQSARGVLNSY